MDGSAMPTIASSHAVPPSPAPSLFQQAPADFKKRAAVTTGAVRPCFCFFLFFRPRVTLLDGAVS